MLQESGFRQFEFEQIDVDIMLVKAVKWLLSVTI
jgi:hypothetical protein